MQYQTTAHTIKVCFYVFFPAGGIGRYTRELLREMSGMPEVEVEAVCTPEFHWKDAAEYTTWPGLRSISHPVPLLRRTRFLQGQFVNPLRAVRYAKATGADVIHFSNINHLSFPVWRAAVERAGLRVAATAHDVVRQKRMINRAWEDRQLKAFYRFADALFVHSAYQADELVRFAGVDLNRIHIVPHGPYAYDPPTESRAAVRTRLGIPQEAQVALFFGQIRDEKNLSGFLRALPLAKARPHVLVAGKAGGRHRDVRYYRELAGMLGVADRITFVPRFIPDAEVGNLFNASDWVALPYRNAFTSQSGVLNVAAHFERPVLASSSPVLRETVQDSDIGVVCGGDDPAALAVGIDALCRRLEAGYVHPFAAYRQEYSWRENARRTLDVYGELLR